MDIRTCVEVKGVGAELAEKIIREILNCELTDDERVFFPIARRPAIHSVPSRPALASYGECAVETSSRAQQRHYISMHHSMLL